MQRTRWDYIQRKKAESGQTGTTSYDLPEHGWLKELMITAFCAPTASTTPATPLSDILTKIEIVDGGLVLKSLTGNQIKALSMIHGHNPLGSTETNDNGVEGYDQFFIPMGGVFDGVEYAPNMKTFNNPQIRLTWDASIATTEFGMTTAAITTPAMKFSILAQIQNEAGKLQHGYVKSQIVKEFTQATDTNTYIEIPRGDKLIGLGIEAGYDALDWTEDVQELKLDINNGEWIPFHLREEEVMAFQQMIYKKPFEYNWVADLEDSDEVDWHMGYLNQLSLMAQRAADCPKAGLAYCLDAGHKGVETLCMTDVATPTQCDEYRAIMCKATGWAPFHMWYCPVNALTQDEDTLDTTAFGRIELELLSGGSASTSSTPGIIAEYLRT